MEPSNRARRVAAGSSGGLFNLSFDATGAPQYQYQSGFGQQSIENDNIKGHPASQADSLRTSQTRLDSSMHKHAHGYHIPVLQEIKNIKTSTDDTAFERQRKWTTSASKLKNKASTIHDRVRARLSNLKLRQDRENEIVSDYTIDLEYEVEAETAPQVAVDPMPKASPCIPGYFGPHTRSDLPEFEDGYFSTTEDYLHAEANFSFFCSMPHPTEEESNNLDNDHNPDPDNQYRNIIPLSKMTNSDLLRDMRNHYDVLHLTQSCDDALITLRARRLIANLHPDRLSSRTLEQKATDTQECARISLAKTELLDPELRAKHNGEISNGTWPGVPYV